MFRSGYIFATLLLLLVPLLSYAADDTGVIGSNLWLDFYSRIDDAWDTLAQGIVRRRLSERGTYGSLGCGASWISDISINQSDLDALRDGNTAILGQLASPKRVDLTTVSESSLRQCLVEKYNEIDRAAHQDQDALETVGNVGLYMDGDTANSDYDIASDIARINSIIFKQRYDYIGTKNASAQAITDLLSGKSIAPLWGNPTTGGSSTSSPSSSPISTPPSPVSAPVAATTASSTPSTSSTSTLPWAWVCRAGWSTSTTGGLFGDGFFDGIDSSLAGGVSDAGVAYSPGGSTAWGGSAGAGSADFGLSEWSDFFHTPECDGIFCITIDMIAGNKGTNGAGKSIEWLLEKHSEMMDPVSRSDLALQEMTMTTYQLPFLNIKFKNLIKKPLVDLEYKPQLTKTLKKEDTKAKKDDTYDDALRCAMAEAGLPGDLSLANWFGWAGYAYLTHQTTADIGTRVVPVTPSEMDSLAGCYALRMGQGQATAYKSLSTDLNEIQAFTSAMMDIIMSIIESDKSIDKIPAK